MKYWHFIQVFGIFAGPFTPRAVTDLGEECADVMVISHLGQYGRQLLGWKEEGEGFTFCLPQKSCSSSLLQAAAVTSLISSGD